MMKTTYKKPKFVNSAKNFGVEMQMDGIQQLSDRLEEIKFRIT
jgi:hypothetical protein